MTNGDTNIGVAENAGESTAKRALNILIVEDNYADAQILSTLLKEREESLNITIVEDGELAAQYLTRRGPYSNAAIPDAILLDINLPKKNGFELLAEIRQDSRACSIPVFVVSSSRNPEDVRRGEALNISAFFQKPTDIDELESLASELVEIHFPKNTQESSSKSEHRVVTKAAAKVRALQAGDNLFRQLVSTVKDYAIFVLDPQGYILTWNEGAERIKGYQPAEIIGKHFSIFYPKEANDRHHPAYELDVAARTGRFQEEGWRLKKDGTRFWASVTITAIRDKSGTLIGFGKVTRDYSERREFEKDLRESERRFRLLVEEVKDYAIFMLTPLGIIASWNLGAERIKGYKSSEVIGRHFSIFYTREALDNKHPEMELRVAREKGVYEEEGLRIRKDGSSFWANVVITALYDEEGKLQGFSKVTRDITDKKRIEEQREKFAAELEARVVERTQELESSRKELIKQRDQLARSNADAQQFAYVASHDLQEPLRSVVSCLQLIEKRHLPVLPAEMTQYMHFAIDASKRMKALIEGLLQYGRVGQGFRIEEKVDLHKVAMDVVSSLHSLLQEAGAKVDVRSLPTVSGDSTLLAMVFQNLISNAIKYRREEPLKIEIDSKRADLEWIISVKDNGIGIAPAYFERIFAIFQRLHSDRERFPGTGIGLAICKRVIETHRGRIWLESEEGRGTTFYFSLPVT